MNSYLDYKELFRKAGEELKLIQNSSDEEVKELATDFVAKLTLAILAFVEENDNEEIRKTAGQIIDLAKIIMPFFKWT